MVVQHNMQAANANRMLGLTVNSQQKSTEKLSSGYRINRAADDAAGLAISEKMRSQIRGLDRASTNAQDGISVVQTAEGALNEVHSMLQRMNELATQAANDTNTSQDRSQIQLEVDQLTSEIDRVSSTTQFNTMNLLDGNFTGKNLQVGSLSGQTIELNIGEMSAKGLGIADAKRKATADDKTGKQHGHVASVSGKLKATDVTFDTTAATGKITANDIKWTGDNPAAAMTLKYDPVNKSWHDANDPTSTDVSSKITIAAGYIPKDGSATITVGTTGAVTGATNFQKGGADFAITDITGTIGDDVKDGIYTYDTTDSKWKDASGAEATLGISFATGKSAANGATITVTGHKDEIKVGDDIVTGKNLDVTTHDGAEAAMQSVQDAIDKVSTQRANLGAVQNRLEHTIANLDNVSENTQSAESRIRDTDMAKEMLAYSKNNILAQAGQSMLAQANQSNQGVLSLLQ
ncbi:MAG: flagellin [Lachnospiraceae bacterium]|nr:flagellin [Lachnospiraceae bacterium]